MFATLNNIISDKYFIIVVLYYIFMKYGIVGSYSQHSIVALLNKNMIFI